MTAVEPLVLSVGAPANGLYATGKDLVRWLEFLLGEGELDGRRIVDAGALRETWTPHTAIGTSGPDLRAYGLGWYLSSRRGRRHMFHGGGGVGFTSQVRLFPRDGVAVAVLANRMASALPDVVAERASELLLGDEDHKDLLDRAVEMTARIEALHEAAGEALRSTTDPEAPPSVGVSSLAGCYANPAFGELEVWVEDDAAGVRFHGIDHTLDHLHDNVFVLSSPYTGDHSAAFTVDAGVVSSVSVPLGSPELDRVFTRGAGSCVNGEVGLDPVKLTAETLNRHRR